MKRSKQYIILLCILTILISLWICSLRTEHYQTPFASPSPSPAPYLFASPSPSPSPAPYLFASPSPSPYLQKRLALIIRGEAFRNGGVGTRNHGNPNSYEEQKKACETHMQLIKKIESLGYVVDVYINSYVTKFNKDLEYWYGGYLKKSRFHEKHLESQKKMMEDSIQLMNSQGIHYDALLILRIDLFLKEKFIHKYNPDIQNIQFLNVVAHHAKILKTPKGNPFINDVIIHYPKHMYDKIPALFTDNMHYTIDTPAPLEILNKYTFMIDDIFDSNTEYEFNNYYRMMGRAEGTKRLNEGKIYPRDF